MYKCYRFNISGRLDTIISEATRLYDGLADPDIEEGEVFDRLQNITHSLEKAYTAYYKAVNDETEYDEYDDEED